jgi:nitrogen fixation/metabolism regulation signal transduction histidine kinase
MASPSPPQAASAPYKRRLRNFLLDARFQLKFASYIVGITLVISAFLGIFLYKNALNVFAQVDQAVEARSKAAETSRQLGLCTLNNDMAKNLDNPDFMTQLTARSEKIDKEYEQEKNGIVAARVALIKQQRVTALGLAGALIVFILVVGLGTIVATHRIVGPLFRVKRMANEVAGGKVVPPTYGLRPSDELKDVFDAFANMVKKLYERQQADAAEVEAAIAAIKPVAPEPAKKLEALLEAMRARTK